MVFVGGMDGVCMRVPALGCDTYRPYKGSVTVAFHSTHGRTVTQSESCVSRHCGAEVSSLAKAGHLRGIKPAYARCLSVAAELVRQNLLIT